MDISYLLLLQQFREGTGGIFNGFFQFLTDLGWSVLPFLIVAMVYWCMDKKIGEYMLINSAASSWLNSLFKLTACIYRPWIRSDALKPLSSAQATATGYSFPSGHMANAVAVYGGLAVKEKQHKAIRNWLIVLVLLIGFSRNYVGVHTPQDVLVSGALGIFLLWATARLLAWVEAKEGRDLWFLLGCAAVVVISIVYFSVKPYPMDYVDGTLLVDPAKMRLDGYGNSGSLLGFALGWFLERRYVRFSTDVDATRKLARFLPGGLVFLLLFQSLGSVLVRLLPAAIARVTLGVALMLFLTWLYPAIFTALERKTAQAKR